MNIHCQRKGDKTVTSPRQEQHNAKKVEWMEKCFECYAENGLTGTGMKALAKACGCNINGRQHIQSGKYFRFQRRSAGTENHGGSCGRGCRGIAGRCAFRFGIHFIETQKAVLMQPAQPYKQ